METKSGVKLGFCVPPRILSNGFSCETFMDFLLDKRNLLERILLDLREYLVTYSKAFGKATIVTTTKNNMKHPNGTLEGLSKLITQSEIDIAV